MWPPTRRAGPPSRSVLRGWGVGEEGVPSGVRRRSSLQGSRCSVATNVFVRDMDLATLNALDGLRLESCGRVHTVARSAISSGHHNGVPSAETGLPNPGPLTTMAPPGGCTAQQGNHLPAPDWWFSPLRWGADGMPRRRSSSQLWPELVPTKCLWSCKVGPRLHGLDGGVPSSPALLHVLSLCLCWARLLA